MSFTREPQPDACRALMPSPQPPPPGPPSVPMACHMPKGHDGPHARERHPGPLSRRWEGDARPPVFNADLPNRPEGPGWQGPQIIEQTPSGWWLRRTDMQTVGAQHVELFEPNGNKVAEAVRWR